MVTIPGVGRIVYASRRAVFGRWSSYRSSPPLAVLSSHDAGVASDQTELTVVPSVLAELQWCAYSC
jgi:hypothetical protein